MTKLERPPERRRSGGGESVAWWVKPLLLASAGFFLLALLLALLFRSEPDPPAAQTAAPSPSPQATQDSMPTIVEPTPPPYVIPDELPDWIQVDLLPVNEWSRPGEAMEAINGVVVHYTGNPGTEAWQNRSFFARQAEEHEYYVSSNFIVGMQGEILLCVPMGEVAYCSNFRNSDTLSIEVCHPDSSGEFTEESYASLVKLVRWLMETFDLGVDDVLRHYDVTGKECPRHFVKDPAAWEAFKADLVDGGQGQN